jgi:hypothetical protein
MGKLKGYGKKELVAALTQYFERTGDPAAMPDEQDRRGFTWCPGVMSFPARSAMTVDSPG